MVRHSGISVFLFSEVPDNSSNYNLIQHNNNTSSHTGYSLIEKYRSGELRLLYTIQSCWAPFTVHYTDLVSSVYRALYRDTDLVSSLRLDAMTFGSAPRGESKPGGQNNWGGYNGDKNRKNRDLERYWIKKKRYWRLGFQSFIMTSRLYLLYTQYQALFCYSCVAVLW